MPTTPSACHIVGGGPIPVRLAREMAKDAFLKAVLHDGVNIHTVKHFGRHIPAELRTALELGPLPDLDGVTCSDEGCDRRYGLEWDHDDPFSNGGPTSYENLNPAAGRTTGTRPNATARPGGTEAAPRRNPTPGRLRDRPDVISS